MKTKILYHAIAILTCNFALALMSQKALAQDPQFSQYYAAPLYINPGFTGTIPGQRIALNSRVQWTQLKSPFVTHAASYDIYSEHLNSGFGIIAITDKAGSANLSTTTIGGLYSAKIRLSDGWMLSPGLNFSYGNRGIDFDKLVFGDQIEYNGPTLDDAISQINNRNYFDFGSGAVIYNKSIWLGFAAAHINQPNHSLLGEDAKLPMKTLIHGGVKIPIKTHVLSKVKLSSISPSFMFSQQGEFQQFDAGFNLVYNPILIGLWYRGIPIQKNYSNRPNQDALIFLLGINLKNLEVGYSYDLSISQMSGQSGGSHEISIIYQFDGLNPRKVRRKDKYLPCPNYPYHRGYSSK